MLGKCGLNAHMGGLLVEKGRGGGVVGEKNEKKVLPQAVCNQFDSIPDRSVTLEPN